MTKPNYSDLVLKKPVKEKLNCCSFSSDLEVERDESPKIIRES